MVWAVPFSSLAHSPATSSVFDKYFLPILPGVASKPNPRREKPFPINKLWRHDIILPLCHVILSTMVHLLRVYHPALKL